jgi:hypothetical protein
LSFRIALAMRNLLSAWSLNQLKIAPQTKRPR